MKENDKTSHRAELMRDIVAMVNQNPVLKQAWQRKKEKSIQNTEFEYPEHLSVEHIDMGLFKMEYLTWNGSENPYVILQENLGTQIPRSYSFMVVVTCPGCRDSTGRWQGFTPRSAVERQCFLWITGWHRSTHFRRH